MGKVNEGLVRVCALFLGIIAALEITTFMFDFLSAFMSWLHPIQQTAIILIPIIMLVLIAWALLGKGE